jgi:hypothetical protein
MPYYSKLTANDRNTGHLSILMLRITDLDSGKSVDLGVEDVLLGRFREQIDRGRNPKNLKAFRQRLESRIEVAITDAIDLNFQPPLPREINDAIMLASILDISIPKNALRRRSVLLRFLHDHKYSEPPSSQATTEV